MDCHVSEQILSFIRKLQEDQKTPRDYGTGQPLYHSEVIFLDTVYRSPDANVSQLSALLGITKGAVTQQACRLMDKSMIEQYKHEGNKKEKYYRLTPLGKKAQAGYARFYTDSNAKLCSYFSSLSPEDSAVIFDFLTILQEAPPSIQFSCINEISKQRGSCK